MSRLLCGDSNSQPPGCPPLHVLLILLVRSLRPPEAGLGTEERKQEDSRPFTPPQRQGRNLSRSGGRRGPREVIRNIFWSFRALIQFRAETIL